MPSGSQKRYFLWFCAFCLFVALLELGQDYISSVLNGNVFVVSESLSYKLFWPLFIPLSTILYYSLHTSGRLFTGLFHLASVSLTVITLSAVHLLLFSLVLFGISTLIHENPVTLMYLLYEKLSTRLYIALSVYTTLSALYFYVVRKRSKEKKHSRNLPGTITVKNGRRSVLVDVADIQWIASDGAYLDIHTPGKKHVVVDSLKNMIENLPDNFKRIHRSTIVNIDGIRELQSRGNGDYDVIMEKGEVLRLSRNYAGQLRGILL